MARIPVFVSAPKSFLKRQETFLKAIERSLTANDLSVHPGSCSGLTELSHHQPD